MSDNWGFSGFISMLACQRAVNMYSAHLIPGVDRSSLSLLRLNIDQQGHLIIGADPGILNGGGGGGGAGALSWEFWGPKILQQNFKFGPRGAGEGGGGRGRSNASPPPPPIPIR